MRRARGAEPKLFGSPGRWSERKRCWSWRVHPLTACAYQTPTGGWWISGSVNSFPMASRPQATIQRAIGAAVMEQVVEKLADDGGERDGGA